jgi:metal-responsive CopG/Arc/MetJ family transcriptional regulator
MNENGMDSNSFDDKVEISIQLDSTLLDQLQHLTKEPSKVIEVAIRQWLRGETQRDDELTRTIGRTPVPPRGEWND